MKVKFENPTGHKFDVRFPGIILHIPAHARGKTAVIANLPELPVVEAWLTDLTARHRAIKVSYAGEDDYDPKTAEPASKEDTDSEEGSKEDISDESGASVSDQDGEKKPETDSKPEDDEGFELFKTDVVSVKSSGSGWWSVEMKDSDPIKVRAANQEEATKEAFKSYMEG